MVCGYVEFKSEQYFRNGTSAFIKDMMAMANSPTAGRKYIIIGVAEKAGSKKLVGLSQPLADSATYYQAIHSAIEPEIKFSIKTVTVDNKQFGVFIIEENKDKPYMMKKDVADLKKGECYIRKGSSQDRLIRRDLDEIWEQKAKMAAFDGDVTMELVVNAAKGSLIPIQRFVVLPSAREAEQIRQVLRNFEETPPHLQFLVTGPGVGYYEDMSQDELVDQLSRIEITYKSEDLFEKFEKLGSKVNLLLTNTGSMYLEDITVIITIPAVPGLELAPKKYYEGDVSAAVAFQVAGSGGKEFEYPLVKLEADAYEIQQSLGTLRHGLSTKLFMTDLRIFAGQELSSQKVDATVMIHAKNLVGPLERTIHISFGE